MSESGLNEIRNKLDRIDNKLLELLNERMELVHQVGAIKAQSGGAIYRPEREKSIIDRLDSLNKDQKGFLNRSAIEALFLEIFAISRNLELPENIGYLGPKGSFTHQAAESRFGAMSSYVSISSIKGIFKELKSKKIKYGVVPIENSSNGIVNDTINGFTNFDSKIVAEVVLNIHHTLATTCDKIEDIKKIYSKDIAFDQCRRFLNNYGLDEVELIPVESTTKAAKLAVVEKNSAAICAHVAAKLYNLPILFENIEDKDNNKTRFFILSDFENAPSGNDKTSLLAKFPDEQGVLVKFLNDLNDAKINLTKIKSHIIEGDSIFFIDFDGHKDDDNIKKVLEKHKSSVKVLGSYVKEIKDI